MMAGIDQAPLADALGMSRNTISNYETGKTDVPAWVMVRYAEATGVSLEWLAYGRNAKAPAEAGADVRHEGFEPPTFWSVAAAGSVVVAAVLAMMRERVSR